VQTLRNVAAFTVTVVVFAVSFVLLQSVIGAASPWLGLLLMFYFMGLAKVGEPLFVLAMPQALQAVRPWETSGPVYRRMAVAAFGRMLRDTPLRYLNTGVYLARNRVDMRTLYRHAESAEATHFWAMVLFMPYIAYVWFRGQAGVAALFLLVQLLFHIYPILHLRAVRARLDDHFARTNIKRTSATVTGDA
jgi:hypothetical protein